MNGLPLASLFTALGLVVGVATLGAATAADPSVTGQAASTLPVRAVVPLLAADSAPGVQPTATPSTTPTAGTPSATATGTNTPTPTATGTACGGGTATITGLDKVAEVVTLSVSGNLTGWKLVSVTGIQTFNFPTGFVGSGSVQVKSNSPLFANTPSMLWWSTSNLWNNSSNDDAQLFNCSGQLIQTFDDGD